MKELDTKVVTADLSSLIQHSAESQNAKGLNRFGRTVSSNPVNQHKNTRPNNAAYTQVVKNAMKGK